ncbi:MAG: glycosyltransferase [Ignavibacteria bacterium]|nr:glycosyltransferase [Ignavibacteria bacterium]
MKAKILHISNDATIVNGITNFLMELTPGLKRMGYEQELVFFNTNKDDEVLRYFDTHHIKYYFLPKALHEKIQNRYLKFLLKFFMVGFPKKCKHLKSIIVQSNPQLIFFHGEEPEATRIFLRLNVRTVGVPHNEVFFPIYPLQKYLLNLSRRKFNVIVLFDERHNYIAPSIYKIIPIGLDFQKFSSIKNSISTNFIIGTIGRIAREKNLHLMIEVIEKLKEYNIKLLIAGEGNRKKELIHLVKQKKLECKVEFLGTIKNKLEFYSKINLLLNMSKYEGMPLTILEALSSGIPVVSANVGVISNIIQNGYNGFLIDGWDIKKYSEKILELIQDEKMFYTFSNNARIKSESFSIEKCIEKYSILIDELLDMKN